MANLQDTLDQIKNVDFNDVDRIGVWPAPLRVLIFILAFAAIIFAAYMLFTKSVNEQITRAESEETNLKTQFEQKALEAANLDAYREQIKKMDESFGDLLAQLPKETEVPGLLEDIDDRVRSSRLEVDLIKLEPEIRKEFYTEVPITIKLRGGYHEFGSFVSGIAGMSRIVTLDNFNIAEQSANTDQLKMDITARTYRYKSEADES